MTRGTRTPVPAVSAVDCPTHGNQVPVDLSQQPHLIHLVRRHVLHGGRMLEGGFFSLLLVKRSHLVG